MARKPIPAPTPVAKPEKPVLALNDGEWITILRGLAKLPYEESAPLIVKVQQHRQASA